MMCILLITGDKTNGTKSWFYIGKFGIQPSEFAKVVIILFTAVYYNINAKSIYTHF